MDNQLPFATLIKFEKTSNSCKASELHFKNGPSEQRRGNRAYMPPEILTAKIGKDLDYRQADRKRHYVFSL